MKYPYILLLKGGENSKNLYAISDDKNRLTIPIFTDGIKCNKFIKKSIIRLTPTVIERDDHLLMLLQTIGPLTITRWIVINPINHLCAEESGGECYQLNQIIANLKHKIKIKIDVRKVNLYGTFQR